MSDNSHVIRGTIYAKDFTEIQGKKDPMAKYPKYVLTLEVKTPREIKKDGKEQFITTTTFPQLESFGVNLDGFDVKDFVEIRFFLQGRPYKGKDGQDKIMTKAMIQHIKYADIDGGHGTHKGKVKVESTTDPKELDIFVVPDPGAEADPDFDGLPFIFATLIGIGSLIII